MEKSAQKRHFQPQPPKTTRRIRNDTATTTSSISRLQHGLSQQYARRSDTSEHQRIFKRVGLLLHSLILKYVYNLL